jgi:hypothetical protein
VVVPVRVGLERKTRVGERIATLKGMSALVSPEVRAEIEALARDWSDPALDAAGGRAA